MWILKHDPTLYGYGWIYSKPTESVSPSGELINFETCWWFPVKPTKKQLRQARKNKLH
ncbi:DUF7279 family protein [Klebsiella pneumoniae]|uniref:DUF7279 family protein n=1 Tax=Klebsiella pneumoniae TaxID=573 RepID=UPI003CC8D305